MADGQRRFTAESKRALFAELAARFGDRFSLGQALREQHANTLTWLKREPPDAVLFAETEADVAEVVKLCAAARVPVIPFGTGTSLEGHVNAPLGGVSLDLSRMNRILAVHEADLDCVVEPGVTRKQLNDHLRGHGLVLPGRSGRRRHPRRHGGDARLRHQRGALRHHARRGARPDRRAGRRQRIVHTGGRARKSSAGYDLTRLLVGSEGTLGVITSLTLKLYGIPETILAAVCPFASIEGACNATIAALQMGLPLARIELLDEVQIRACNAYSHLTLPETPTLFLEFHGTQASAREQVEAFADIAHAEGGGDYAYAERPEDRTKLWQARHDAYWAARGLRPGADVLTTDVCVPISALAACVTATREDIDRLGLIAPIVGHVGDGNFHVMPLIDPADPEERRKVQAFLDRLVERALSYGGTCTGEHGIGQGKMFYLAAEHGPGVSAMIAIKKALDPLNILNPGKIFALP